MESGNMKLEIGKVYIGLINNEPAIYTGFEFDEEMNMWLHNFEYVEFDPVVLGYSQRIEEVELEEYQLCEAFTVLYGS